MPTLTSVERSGANGAEIVIGVTAHSRLEGADENLPEVRRPVYSFLGPVGIGARPE